MKTTAANLVEEISDDLNQFLKFGNLRSFTEQIDPNLNIDNLAKLLRIHFVLTTRTNGSRTGVIDFVEDLSQRLRRIKTTTRKEHELFEGEVKGRINWKDTISVRYNQNPEDKMLFVCDKREKNYDIAENLVLKRLLQIIHSIIYNDLKPAFDERYPWLKGWFGEGELKSVLDHLYLRNAYLRRIDLTQVVVTERMINRAAKSRTVLYREAAELLTRFNKLMKYELDPSEAKELLSNTFIKPAKIDTLFELYWIINIVKQFKDPTFGLIEPGSSVVATWISDGYTYRICHNSVGSCEFIEKAGDIIPLLIDKDNYLGRELKVLEKLEQMTGIKTDSLWGGRPDIVLEKYDQSDSLVAIFIGEVKYTQDRGYAIQGLKELLEYLALIKRNGMYVEEYRNIFKKAGKVKGCLFLDIMDDGILDIADDETVQIVMFGKDTNNLSGILHKWDQQL